MFEFFKSNEKKVRELTKKNENIFNERTNKFYYSLNPNFISEYVVNNIYLIYSLQELKFYSLNPDAAKLRTIELESINFVASIADKLLHGIDFEYYEVGDIIDCVIKKAQGPGVYQYHRDYSREIINEQIYTRDYGENNFRRSLDSYISKINSISPISPVLNDKCIYYLEKYYSFLSEYANELIHKSENINADKNINFDSIDDKYVEKISDSSEYQPEVFPYGYVYYIALSIDNYLLNKLNISLNDIDMNYYKDFPYTAFVDDHRMQIFRNKIAKACRSYDGRYHSAELKLDDKMCNISGYEIIRSLNKLFRTRSFKKELKYLF